MRILYICADHGIPVFGEKGASIHIQQLVKAFMRTGNEVTVLASHLGERNRTIEAEVIKVRAGIDKDAELARLGADNKQLANEHYRLAIAAAMEEAIVERFAAAPFDFIYERYSLWSAASVRAAKRLGIPAIVEVNAPLLLEQSRYRKLILKDQAAEVEREVFSGAHALSCVSAEMRDYVVARGAPDDRAVVVPNGVDLTTFRPDVAPAADPRYDGRFVIGFVGSLKGWHDHETLLDAFATLHARKPDTHLLIVGDGPSRGWIDGYVRGAKIDDAVTITGWVDHEDLPALVARMDIAAAPYPDIDGFYFSPLKLFEYQAAGCAIVASAVGQVVDLVEHERTGLLVRPSDVEDLAAKFEQLHGDRELAARLGAAAGEAAQGHSWDNNAEQMIERARELLQAA